MLYHLYVPRNLQFYRRHIIILPSGSSPGHSPVLNLSKSGSGERERERERERGERGEGSASGRSSAASRRTPQPPRIPSTAAAASPRSHTDDSDPGLSDQEDHNVKDEDDGKFLILISEYSPLSEIK